MLTGHQHMVGSLSRRPPATGLPEVEERIALIQASKLTESTTWQGVPLSKFDDKLKI